MSYNAGSLKWGDATLGESSGEITWSADLTSGLNYNSGLYSQADFDAALQDAFDAWEEIASIDFTYVTGGADVDVVVGYLAGSTVGLANYSYWETGAVDTIFSGTVTMDSEETWSPYGDTALDFFAVALHEIGHILGLGHVNDETEIMNPYIVASELGDGDIAGAQYLYGAGGGEAPPVEDPPVLPDPDDKSSILAAAGGGGFLEFLSDLLSAIFGGGSGGGRAEAPPEVAEPASGIDEFLTAIMVEGHGLYADEDDFLAAEEEEDAEAFFL